MIRRVRGVFVAATVLGSALLILLPTPGASAHEEVELGKVSFEIGFLNEPVYVGFQNGVFLFIHDHHGDPVTTAAETLMVKVGFGDETMDVPLEPHFDADAGGEPGQYVAFFIPTRPGTYIFHLSGSIDGEKIDESYMSSPTTFDEAVDPTSVEFPVKDPTLGQVAQRLEREFPRIESQLASTRQAADDGASSAKTLAYVGIGLGAIGLIVAIAALRAGRRRASETRS